MASANFALRVLMVLSCGFSMAVENDQTLIEARSAYLAALVDANPGMDGTDLLLSLSTWEESETWTAKTRDLDLSKLDLQKEADAVIGLHAILLRTVEMQGLAARCANRGSPKSVLRCYRTRLKTVCEYMQTQAELAGTSYLLGEDLGNALANASRSCEDALAEFNSDLSSEATPDHLDDMSWEMRRAAQIFEKRKTYILDLPAESAP